MSFFNDDPFEDIVREFFGGSPAKTRRKEQFIRGEEEDRIIDFVEDDEHVYLVFELPGYNEKDVRITVKGKELEINAKKTNGEGIQSYLNQKLRHGFSIRKSLPNVVDTKKMKHSMRNGILEIVFDKIKLEKNERRKIKIG